MNIEEEKEANYLFKILIIGDTSCGKSNILLRFTDNKFVASFQPTIGVDFKIKNFEIDCQLIKAQIWDTAGQERFRTIVNSYYKGSHGIMLVYDITDAQSFSDIEM